MSDASPYQPRCVASPRHLPIRGLRYHLHEWAGDTRQPLLLMMHGWMDVGASFQFVVDAMAGQRRIVAADWRGFGRTEAQPGTDSYWFADYFGDLDALIDALSPDAPVDLLGHSMGGNIVMGYAGVRPQRIRRLVNLEGFGLPDLPPDEAPQRLVQWLDELKADQRLRPYASVDEVAQRLRRNNPRIRADRAAWLARHWAAEGADGRWHILADPAHRRVNPVPYRAGEAVAMWRGITAPTLWVQGRQSDPEARWQGRYSLAEFQQRLAEVRQVEQVVLDEAGHMLHHDQPEALAAVLDRFLA